MIVFLSGLSGVGKTTTARAFVRRHPNFKHVIASALLRDAGVSLEPANESQVRYNQEVLINQFKAIREGCPDTHFLFDGHMIIETANGNHAIADEIIDGLTVSHFVVMVDNAYRIRMSREAVQKRLISPVELERLQSIEVQATLRHAERTGRPFFQVQSGQIAVMEDGLGLRHDTVKDIFKPLRPI